MVDLDPGPPQRTEKTTDSIEYKRALDAIYRYYRRRCNKLIEIDIEITEYSPTARDVLPLISSDFEELHERAVDEKRQATRCYWSLTDIGRLQDDDAALAHLYDADTRDPLVTHDGRMYRDIVRLLSDNYYESNECKRRADRLLKFRNMISEELDTLERDIQQSRNALLTSVIAMSSLATILLTAFNLFFL